MIPYIILLVVVLIIIFIFKLRDVTNDFNSILVRIHDGENEIDELLKRKGTLLDEVCDEINNLNDNRVFSSVKKVTNKSIDSLKLDRSLSEIYSELKEYLVVNKSFVPEDELKAKIDELASLEIDLEATKLFYNDNSTLFNDLIDKFPARIVAHRKGYDFKFLYTFEKEEFFEILKKDSKKKKEA